VTAPTLVVVPGLGNSGPQHWQSLWEARHPGARRVEQGDWDRPDLGAWVAALDATVRAAGGPVALAAHSLACALVAHWAVAHDAGPVRGALLVSPSDVDSPAHTPDEVRCFAPMPTPLPGAGGGERGRPLRGAGPGPRLRGRVGRGLRERGPGGARQRGLGPG